MSIYLYSSSATASAVQSIRSSEAALVQSVTIDTSQAVNSVKTANDTYHHPVGSVGGDHHQVSVPTDLSTLVKGG